MIVSLQGRLARKSATEVVIDVHGVGYGVSIPVSTYERLGDVDSDTLLLTYLHVREDTLQLYGFATEEEREMFRLLLSVTGIGPKMAQGILSGIPVPELKKNIGRGNAAALTSIPGVGRKTAERLVVELREKISKLEPGSPILENASDAQVQIRSEAMAALTALGYTRSIAERALRAAIQENNGSDATVEQLIKSALRHAAK